MSLKAFLQDIEDDMDGVPKEELRQVLQQKARDLFVLCDKEDKGFTTKRDMHRLQEELPLTPEQLDEVFGVLDRDHNGYLTLEEFTDGFGMFLGIDTQPFIRTEKMETKNSNEICARKEKEEEEEDERFEDLLDELGAHNVFKDEDYIRQMWQHVKKDDPVMLQNFEDFLEKITQELKCTKNEFSTLESTLKNRSNVHDEQVQLLYTEMEEQLKAEKEILLSQEKLKEKKIRSELETELHLRDQQLQDLLSKHAEIEKQLEELNVGDSETRYENVKLQKERDTLETQLQASERVLADMQSHLQLLRQRSLDEKRKRAKAAFKVSEGIALEREDLVMQLNQLKQVNKQLLDEKDELVLSATHTPINGSDEDSPPPSVRKRSPRLTSRFQTSASLDHHEEREPSHSELIKKRSNSLGLQKNSPTKEQLKKTEAASNCLLVEVLPTDCSSTSPNWVETGDNYCDFNGFKMISTPLSNPKTPKSEDDCEVDDHFFDSNPHFVGLPPKELALLQNNLNLMPSKEHINLLQGYTTDDSEDNSREKSMRKMKNSSKNSHENKCKSPFSKRKFNAEDKMTCPTNSNSNSYRKITDIDKPLEGPTPDRLFKIVFIGDSGVGKSSFIHRFCHNTFRSTFSATIGVDFQVKTVITDGRLIALQLWDTAGQERFRSLTKQYFRKADGIIIVYDVTSETSFKNVRNWISQVKEGADEHVVIMLIGNKIDLCDSEDDRVIKPKDGNWLADEYGTLFFETSAKTGSTVQEAINALSSLLQEKEDEVIEKVFQLQESIKQKKKCC